MPDRTLPTTCPLDCPDSCALEVSVRGDRVARIRGRRHPVTAGFICRKVSRFGERVHHRDRLRVPMRRAGAKGEGRFEPITWDEAVATITERFRAIRSEWGGEAIVPYHYGGSNGLLTDGFLDDLYFARLGASRLARTLCATPTTKVAIGMYGKMPGVAFQNFVHAGCIVIWGANPKASNIHLMPFLRAARKRGAFVAVIDPVRNLTAREADLHVPVYPGTDLPVALSLIEFWREHRCLDEAFLAEHVVGADRLLARAREWPIERAAHEARVNPADLVRLAKAYAVAEPAVVRCGWGVERNRNGGQAVAAILALPALLGKFGVRGGGYTLSNNGSARVDRARVLGSFPWSTRWLNMTQLGAWLADGLEPPVKGLFIYNCNPVATVPDQHAVLRGLARDDLFTVVFDQVMTDTTPYADVLLPATSFVEHWDLRVSYGSYAVGAVRPAIPPAGESKANADVFALLGRAMGFDDEPFQWDQATAFDRLTEALTLDGRAPDADVLRAGGMVDYEFPGPTPVQFDTVYPLTADGKVHLAPPVLGEDPYRYQPLSDPYPLAMVSPATSQTISSTLGEFNLSKLYVELNPADAGVRGIRDGAPVRVYNELGEVRCPARVRERVRRGVVLMPKGAWRRASQNGYTATALCPAHVSAVGGGACFNDARVEVERAG